MEYYFLGVERMKLFFDTPNHCAVVSGMGALVGVGGLMALPFVTSDKPRPSRKFIFGATLGLSAIIIYLLVVTALTYSRGGYLAILIGFVLLVVSSRKRRYVGIVFSILFLTAILLVPHGPERFAKIGALDDASISNRIVLWRGTLALIWDNLLTGVGRYGFRDLYIAWYQPANRFELYTTAVNDPLTIAAYWGVPTLGLYLSLAFGLISTALAYSYRENKPFISGLAAAITCYFVGSISSTFLLAPKVLIFLFIAIGSAAILLFLSRQGHERLLLSSLKRGVGAALMLTLFIGLASFFSAKTYDYKVVTSARPWVAPGENSCTVVPRNRPLKGTLLFLPERWFIENDARLFLRPFASAGYKVVAFNGEDFGYRGLNRTMQILAEIQPAGGPFFLMGHGEGGRIAVVAASRSAVPPAAVVAVASRSAWPLPALSPRANVNSMRSALLLLHGRRDKQVDPVESSILYEEARKHGVRTALRIFENADHSLSDHWPDAVRITLEFFNNPQTME